MPEQKPTFGVLGVRDLILPGQVTVLAGRPGMGKTALACDLVHISNRRVMSNYISLYEEAESIIERIANRGGVPCAVYTSLEDAFELIQLSEQPDPILVIDYLPFEENEDLSDFFDMMKEYAEEHHFPVLILSQVSRKVDSRKNKRPMLRDLPMQNCIDLIDNVIMLYREDCYTGGNTGKAEAIFVKCPFGKETVDLHWDSEKKSFL